MNHEAVWKAGVAGLVGLVIGWGANALTLAGRVDAIERSLTRIEGALFPVHPVPVPPPVAKAP